MSIDILRGIVMVIMALDHTRDYFSNFTAQPTDLSQASTAMFFTRWITHFCAPVFVFLAGVSAFLTQGTGKTKKQVSFQLFTRGLWLILIEVTVVRFGWEFDVDYSHVFVQVIWALGCSMILLSLLIYLPIPAIITIGLVIVFGHDALDGIKADQMGQYRTAWLFLHEQGVVHYGHNDMLMIFYPLVPWCGLMPLGYCFGKIFKMPEQQRFKWLYSIGLSAIGLFFIIRGINIYGDPGPWHTQTAWWRTIVSFLNVNKYPPSLLYLLMTLGPAISFLPLLERFKGKLADFFLTYGRVPFFYYIMHLYLIHSLAQIVGSFDTKNIIVNITPHPGYSLGIVYFFWILVVILLYLPCRWFMGMKAKYKTWWMSYL